MRMFYKMCVSLISVGGLNWGLIGLFSFNLVGWLFGGSASTISRIIFTLVGLAALGAIPGLLGLGDGSGKSTQS